MTSFPHEQDRKSFFELQINGKLLFGSLGGCNIMTCCGDETEVEMEHKSTCADDRKRLSDAIEPSAYVIKVHAPPNNETHLCSSPEGIGKHNERH